VDLTATPLEELCKSEGIVTLVFYNRYDNNPFAVVLSHGVDPEEVENPLEPGSISQLENHGMFWMEGKLSVFYWFFDNNFEYREGTAVDFTTVEKKRDLFLMLKV
jgi:hypothetical protein